MLPTVYDYLVGPDFLFNGIGVHKYPQGTVMNKKRRRDCVSFESDHIVQDNSLDEAEVKQFSSASTSSIYMNIYSVYAHERRNP